MDRHRFLGAVMAVGLVFSASSALPVHARDVFGVEAKVPPLPVGGMLENNTVCTFGSVGTPLALVEVVERALCHNPKSRQAWAEARMRSAQVGVRMAAYLPQVEASYGIAKLDKRTTVSEIPQLDTTARPTVQSGALKLSLELSGFGRRRAQLDQAHALLDAANAAHDLALQSALLDAAQHYFDVLTALGGLEAAREAETAAQESFLAAQAKYQAGVGALTDSLQAGTAHAQAHMERVAAEGELKNLQGALALVMGLPVNTPLILVRHDGRLPDTTFVKSVESLIQEARQAHPGLQARRAEVAAAHANRAAVNAEGRPSISLGAELGRIRQHGEAPAIGLPPSTLADSSRRIGVQVTVPLFEGFSRGYRVSAAENEAAGKEAELDQLERQVVLDVWKNYQWLETAGAHLEASHALLRHARESFDVARGRYKAGVGSMIELLNAQSAAAHAEREHVKALSGWHTARLKLAASIGTIGLWAIR